MTRFPADLAAAIDAATPSPTLRRGLRALAMKESAARWRWPVAGAQRPPIAPEPHVFHRLLTGDARARAVALGLAHPRRGAVRVPSSYAGRYDFLTRMKAIDPEAACGATSWGWGQVMGHHGLALGFGGAQGLAEACETAEGQTRAVRIYLARAGLAGDLARLPDRAAAERVAEGFNGPAWRTNNYAGDLIGFWKQLGEDGAGIGPDTRRLQTSLKKLGFDPGEIDGTHGPDTEAAVQAFQASRGIVADGDPGPMTWAELAAAQAEAATAAKTVNTRRIAIGGSATTIAGPAIVEVVRDADGVAMAARSIGDAMGIAGPLLAVAVAAAVGFALWRALR